MIPAISRSNVDLPEPLRPTSPTASPGSIASETPSSACVLRARAAAADEELLETARLVRMDAEAARDPVDPDLACVHLQTVPRRAADQACEHADERRVGVRKLDQRAGSQLARALAGLDVEVPADLEVIGDEADGAEEDVAHVGGGELVQVHEDVGAEPRLPGRRLALEENVHSPRRRGRRRPGRPSSSSR